MDGRFSFTDALTGSNIEFDYASGECFVENGGQAAPVDSIFFPGCSMINYAMPLVEAVYNTLLQHGCVSGISFLCCGKILSYEPDGDTIRSNFEQELIEHVFEAKIKRIVCSCPNCVKALREAFVLDERVSDVEIAVLPELLAGLGYRLDRADAARLVMGDEDADVMLCPHDSCPDRGYGQFADGLRALLPEGVWVDPKHTRKTSVCCGSLPRAAGKAEQANKCADINGQEALDVNADAIVTACMSCTFQLNMAQSHIQCVHFLELMYNWRINWASVGQWMRYRFLFNESLGAKERKSDRVFVGLEANGDKSKDEILGEGIAISDDDVTTIEE